MPGRGLYSEGFRFRSAGWGGSGKFQQKARRCDTSSSRALSGATETACLPACANSTDSDANVMISQSSRLVPHPCRRHHNQQSNCGHAYSTQQQLLLLQTSNGTQGNCVPFECWGCISFATGQVRPMFLTIVLPVEAVRALRRCCPSLLSLLPLRSSQLRFQAVNPTVRTG